MSKVKGAATIVISASASLDLLDLHEDGRLEQYHQGPVKAWVAPTNI